MYRKEDEKQLNSGDFSMPFGGHLDEENCWVILRKKIPWAELEKDYRKKLSGSELGAPVAAVMWVLHVFAMYILAF